EVGVARRAIRNLQLVRFDSFLPGAGLERHRKSAGREQSSLRGIERLTRHKHLFHAMRQAVEVRKGATSLPVALLEIGRYRLSPLPHFAANLHAFTWPSSMYAAARIPSRYSSTKTTGCFTLSSMRPGLRDG